MDEMTKYEHARIVGARALQIAMGAPFMLKLKDEDLQKIRFNPVEIAKMEYKLGLIPMTIKRPQPRNVSELQSPEANEVQ